MKARWVCAALCGAAILVLSLSVFRCDHADTSHQVRVESQDDTLHVGSPRFVASTLEVPFRLLENAKLVIANPDSGGGMPLEASQKMWLVLPDEGGSLFVDGLEVLQGRVEIRNPAEALVFCRLTTSPVTHFLFGREVEVVCADEVAPSFCFGDARAASYCLKQPPRLGVECCTRLRDLDISPARARAIAKKFEITRTLLVEVSTGDTKFVDVVETVSREGAYSRKVIRERSAPPSFLVPFFL